MFQISGATCISDVVFISTSSDILYIWLFCDRDLRVTILFVFLQMFENIWKGTQRDKWQAGIPVIMSNETDASSSAHLQKIFLFFLQYFNSSLMTYFEEAHNNIFHDSPDLFAILTWVWTRYFPTVCLQMQFKIQNMLYLPQQCWTRAVPNCVFATLAKYFCNDVVSFYKRCPNCTFVNGPEQWRQSRQVFRAS